MTGKTISVTSQLSTKIANIAAICAFMVVILHSGAPVVHGSSGWFLLNFLHGFAKASVPFFFIASGFFLAGHMDESGWWKREVVKRVRTLLIPFWEWGAIWWTYLLIMGLISDVVFGRSLGSYLPGQLSIHCLWGWIGVDFINPPLYSVTWYLRSLFVYVVISPLIALGLRRFGVMLFLALYCLDPWGFCKCGTGVMALFHGIAWFALGIGLRKGWVRPLAVSRLSSWLFALAAVAAVILRTSLSYAHVTVPFSLFGVTIPLTLLALWGLVPDRPFMKFVTAVSMPVYLLHSFFISVFRVAVRPNEDSALIILAELFFAYAASLCVANLLARFLPKVSKLLFGNR